MSDRRTQRQWGMSVMVAIGLHLAVVAAAAFSFVHPPQFGVDAAPNTVEVTLASASGPAFPQPEVTPRTPIKPVPVAPSPMPQTPAVVDHTLPAAPASALAPASHTPVTNTHGEGEVTTKAAPNYLKNPAPIYPSAAKNRGQEGTVYLKVKVDAHGQPTDVTLKRSSGSRYLDEEALRVVRTWQFNPARLGAIAVASEVEVPIRFRLQSEYFD